MNQMPQFNVDLGDELKGLNAPTFAEFCRNKEKWLGRADEKLALADVGSQNLKKYVQRHIYEIEGHRCKTLEEVERIATDYGIPISELDYRPEIIPLSGLKCDMLVKFVPKHVREKRDAW